MRARKVLLWAESILEWCDWMRLQGLSENTVELRSYQLVQVATDLQADVSPWRVTTPILARWMGSKNWKNSTRASYRSTLKSFYTWAVQTKRTKANPAAGLPAVKVMRGLPRPTPDPVFEAAFDGVDDCTELAIDMAGYAGMRRAEIAVSRWDWDDGERLLILGKGGKERIVPRHGILGAKLDAERDRRARGERGTGFQQHRGDPGTYIFPGRVGDGHASARTIGRIVSHALGPGWGPHTLRHRFATQALAGSKDVRAVQLLLGHESLDTTQIYTFVITSRLRDAVDAVKPPRSKP